MLGGWVLEGALPPTSAPIPSGLQAWELSGGIRCDNQKVFQYTTGAGYPVDMLMIFHPTSTPVAPIPNYRVRNYTPKGRLVWETNEIVVSRTGSTAEAKAVFETMVSDGTERCSEQTLRVIADDNKAVSASIESSISGKEVSITGADQAWFFSQRGRGCIPNCANPSSEGVIDNPLRMTIIRRGPWVMVIADTELDTGADDPYLARSGDLLKLFDLPI